MGTIVCKECDQIISPIPSEKSEVLFGICDDCNSHGKEK
ncbi:GapA-binding peptide SR1P [Vulcanibacillus modesticaldus]|nr:GapA-binding peptide SR1P [Vulcanibacillus modesticaldus]